MGQTTRVILTADLVVLRSDCSILLIQRRKAPYQFAWALPGGKMNMNETIEACAMRELAEATGVSVSDADLKLIDVFSRLGRDPRGSFISIAFLVEVPMDTVAVAGDDAMNAQWFPLDQMNQMPSNLAFDQGEIVDIVKKVARYTFLERCAFCGTPEKQCCAHCQCNVCVRCQAWPNAYAGTKISCRKKQCIEIVAAKNERHGPSWREGPVWPIF